MGKLTSSGVGLALSLSLSPSVWADCTYNEAEALNSKITSRGITIDATSEGWTPEKKEKLEKIKSRLRIVSDQHNAAVTSRDQNALNTVCEDYYTILEDIDDLAKQFE